MTWQDRLQSVLNSWANTPYGNGQGCRGRATDCVHFVVGVLDELYGLSLPPIPRLPADTSLHDRRGAVLTCLAVSRRYPNRIIRREPIEAGDVLVCKIGLAPGHILIAGRDPTRFWHATNGIGVCQTGLGGIRGLMRIWRPLKKESWSRP